MASITKAAHLNMCLNKMQSPSLLIVLSLFVLLMALSSSCYAKSEDRYGDFNKPMKFMTAGTGGNCSTCEWISAIGIIDEDTPKNLEEFLKNNPYGGTVYLDSPGGNLMAGMLLGKAFRNHHLDTAIGKTEKSEGDYGDYVADQKPGVCASACAYAFLGGETRSIDDGSKIAFHQFYKDGNAQPIKIDKYTVSGEQLISGIIAAYIVEMGVDARLLTLAASAGKDDVVTPPRQLLKELKIINDDESFSAWKLSVVDDGLTAYSLRENQKNLEKKVFTYCLGEGQQAFFGIMTQKTQDYSGAAGAAELKNNLNDATFYFGEDSKLQRAPYKVSKSIFLTAVADDGFLIGIPLSSAIKQKILESSSFRIEVDSPHFLFGTYIGQEFKLSDAEKKMIDYSWKNCGAN